MKNESFELNDVTYHWPRKPVVVVCIDGGDPAYIEQGLNDGIIPNIERFMRHGYYAVADGTMPSFTCPNNMSIVTGAEPDVHGISGNFYLEPETGEPVVHTGRERFGPLRLTGLGRDDVNSIVRVVIVQRGDFKYQLTQ